MARIEFIKGQGGVLNIVNGNIRDTDRQELLNIEDVNRVVINPYNFSPLGFNDELHAMEVAGYIIVFDSNVSMRVYEDQLDMFDGQKFNPGINGKQYPVWDSLHNQHTREIVTHQYENTDVERSLLESNPPKNN